MEADSGSVQERKPGSFSVSELRAKLNGKLQGSKDDPEQDESNKSSITSLDSSLEIPKEEMSPVMRKISQFQTQNSPMLSPSAKGSTAHSRSGSVQPVPNASNQTPKVLSTHGSDDTPKNEAPSMDSSNRPSVSSPSVAALRSQLALNPAMLRPADAGPAKISRSLKRSSADSALPGSCTETLLSTSKSETEKPVSRSSPVTPKAASSRVSDIQQRLALDPNMLLPSPVSGLPSRGHRRGRSTASPAAANPAPDVSHESQMNRPLIANRSRRSRTSSKFACDEETIQTFDEIEKMSTQLDNEVNALLQEQNAETNQSLAVPENPPAEFKSDEVNRTVADLTGNSVESLNTEPSLGFQLASVVQLNLDSDGHQNISEKESLQIGLQQSIVKEEQQVDTASVTENERQAPAFNSDLSDQNPVAESAGDQCGSTSWKLQSPADSKESESISFPTERPLRSSRHRTMDSGLHDNHPVTDSELLQQDPVDEIPDSLQGEGQAQTTE